MWYWTLLYQGNISLIPHLHICARASPRHLHEHLYSSVSMRMNCFHMRPNIYMFVHINVNEPFSPFVPFDSCWKTATRASTTNGEANDATNDKANIWLVRLSFASPFTRMCKCGKSNTTCGRLGDISPLINTIFAFSWSTSCNLVYFSRRWL